MIPARFTAADADLAHETWGANCGPGALAAILGMTLDEVRPHMGDFESKGYTNPTLMWEALKSAGVRRFSYRGGHLGRENWPRYGLARIQWEGPWTAPGVPIRARYRHTHWVGAATLWSGIGIFDINAIGNGSGWCSREDWERTLVPWILENCVPRADGNWHLTHVVEVDPAFARSRAAA